MEKGRKLEELQDTVSKCQKCSLHLFRKNVVFGMGNPETEIMFVGEAPGYHEDIQGLPFVGQAGKLLDRLLKEIGFSREDVYIGNVIKCRPPRNRDPYPEEIETCKPYLLKQIEIINPLLICTLGRFALQVLAGEKLSITRYHGKIIRKESYLLYPLFHPAAALHRAPLYQPLREDFLRIPRILEKMKKNTPSSQTQLSLF